MRTSLSFSLSLSLAHTHSHRADVENQYVNGIHKIAKKAKKATKRCLGTTLEPAWQKFITCLETDEEHHRSLAASLSQDCAKAMKAFTDQQIKTREPVSEETERERDVYVCIQTVYIVRLPWFTYFVSVKLQTPLVCVRSSFIITRV